MDESVIERMASDDDTVKGSKASTGSKSSSQSRSERLKKLKEMKLKSKKLSDKELQQEEHRQRSQKGTLREEHLGEEEVVTYHKPETDNNTAKWSRTLEECEEWNKKQKKHRLVSKSTEYQNFARIAENTYYKSVENIKIEKEAYKLAKQKESQKAQTDITHSASPSVKLYDKPEKAALDALSKHIKSHGQGAQSKKRQRKDNTEVDSFINEKNRQFNLKLNRQFDER